MNHKRCVVNLLGAKGFDQCDQQVIPAKGEVEKFRFSLGPPVVALTAGRALDQFPAAAFFTSRCFEESRTMISDAWLSDRLWSD
jgi:hypothetical protein